MGNAYDPAPYLISGLGGSTSLGAGALYFMSYLARSCAIKSDGSLWCWKQYEWPEQAIEIGTKVKAVAVSVAISPPSHCAITAADELWCWSGDSPPVKVIGAGS